MSKIDCGNGFTTLNRLKTTELYTLNDYCVLCEVYLSKAVIYFFK